ncbi:transaldolase [Melioribacter sp. Ez-97]|uniref:transaldolase n=1 Tax=Melioribacter sp. Ez-97 TaxID=3423434 RepID=UPI003ED9DFA2
MDKLISGGVRGVTTNPLIFKKAISGSSLYDDDLKSIDLEKPIFEIYEALAKKDIKLAAQKLLPVFVETNGVDGYVSLEVNTKLADKTEETVDEAIRLFKELSMTNIMIKVPATQAGIAAIKELISHGINVNVTLIFSIDNYIEVAKTYIDSLKILMDNGGDVSKVSSVASFFVSRVDTSVDKLLEELDKPEFMGQATVANSKIAYEEFKKLFSGEVWQNLESNGARVQRLLWASTSTNNPNYSDILYVQVLIGSTTVNTVPPATIDAFIDHGVVKETLSENISDAVELMNNLKELGISMEDVTNDLQEKGVKAFADAFDNLLNSLEEKVKLIQN